MEFTINNIGDEVQNVRDAHQAMCEMLGAMGALRNNPNAARVLLANKVNLSKLIRRVEAARDELVGSYITMADAQVALNAMVFLDGEKNP